MYHEEKCARPLSPSLRVGEHVPPVLGRASECTGMRGPESLVDLGQDTLGLILADEPQAPPYFREITELSVAGVDLVGSVSGRDAVPVPAIDDAFRCVEHGEGLTTLADVP